MSKQVLSAMSECLHSLQCYEVHLLSLFSMVVVHLQEMFVPAGTSGALTGVLDSHNLLAKKLLELQQARHETRAKQGFADREAIKCEVVNPP